MTKSPGLTDEVFQVSSRISLNIICIGHQSSVLSAMRSCAQWCWSFRYGAISKQEGRLNQMSINQDFTLYLNVPLQTNVPSYFWMKRWAGRFTAKSRVATVVSAMILQM